jgi:hypothetical protein
VKRYLFCCWHVGYAGWLYHRRRGEPWQVCLFAAITCQIAGPPVLLFDWYSGDLDNAEHYICHELSLRHS